ncbi:hypothetical protein Tco_1159832 [Tanacetum coccineum]
MNFTTGRLIDGSPCDGIDMVLKDLDLKPKIDAMMKDYLEMSLQSFAVRLGGKNSTRKRVVRSSNLEMGPARRCLSQLLA